MKKLKAITAKVLLLGIILGYTSCSSSDDDNQSSSYPKEVIITYKVTSTTVTTADVDYTNATGGITQLENQALPYELSFERTVNIADNASVNTIFYNSNTSGIMKDITAEIWIDGNLVKTETGTGNNAAVTAFPIYIFE